MKDAGLTAKFCPSLISETQVGACICSVVKKTDERFVQTTGKKVKVREEGAYVVVAEKPQNEI